MRIDSMSGKLGDGPMRSASSTCGGRESRCRRASRRSADPAGGRTNDDGHGVAGYSLKKVKVSFPR
jgi:hypothetical protein